MHLNFQSTLMQFFTPHCTTCCWFYLHFKQSWDIFSEHDINLCYICQEMNSFIRHKYYPCLSYTDVFSCWQQTLGLHRITWGCEICFILVRIDQYEKEEILRERERERERERTEKKKMEREGMDGWRKGDRRRRTEWIKEGRGATSK